MDWFLYDKVDLGTVLLLMPYEIYCKVKVKLLRFFGIAAFIIPGTTLHWLLKLSIRGKTCCNLREQALAILQDRLKGIKYIIIDEFCVTSQKMLRWIDRRLWQARSYGRDLWELLILVGDTAQLHPVTDKPFYYPTPSDALLMMGYCAYKRFGKVVILVQNECVTIKYQDNFRQLFICRTASQQFLIRNYIVAEIYTILMMNTCNNTMSDLHLHIKLLQNMIMTR